MPGVSYGGLPPRYGVILHYLKEDNYLYLTVHEEVGPPHVVYAYGAADDQGNVQPIITVDYDRRSDLSSAVGAVVRNYLGGDLDYDGLMFVDVDSYDVIFDPDD